jgi:hypothetical protein
LHGGYSFKKSLSSFAGKARYTFSYTNPVSRLLPDALATPVFGWCFHQVFTGNNFPHNLSSKIYPKCIPIWWKFKRQSGHLGCNFSEQVFVEEVSNVNALLFDP